jgi:hypothetical protein
MELASPEDNGLSADKSIQRGRIFPMDRTSRAGAPRHKLKPICFEVESVLASVKEPIFSKLRLARAWPRPKPSRAQNVPAEIRPSRHDTLKPTYLVKKAPLQDMQRGLFHAVC